jgi:hypothetical protein
MSRTPTHESGPRRFPLHETGTLACSFGSDVGVFRRQ